jgi:hypothetical protein
MLRIEPGIFLLFTGLVNIPFYAMEIRHKLCKSLSITVGEIGPVECTFIINNILFNR